MNAVSTIRRTSDTLTSGSTIPKGPHPDLELMVLCTTFCVLEDKIDAYYSASATPIEDDAKRDLSLIQLRKAQTALLPRIEEIRAKTLDGALARAKAACAWAPHLLLPQVETHLIILSAMLRDMLDGERNERFSKKS